MMITSYRETPALLANVWNLMFNRDGLQAQINRIDEQLNDIVGKVVKLNWRRASDDTVFTAYKGVGLQIVEREGHLDAYYMFDREPVLLNHYVDLTSAEAAPIKYLEGYTNEDN